MCGGKSRRYQRLAAPVKQIGMCNRNKAVVSLYNILFWGGAVVNKLQGDRYDFNANVINCFYTCDITINNNKNCYFYLVSDD